MPSDVSAVFVLSNVGTVHGNLRRISSTYVFWRVLIRGTGSIVCTVPVEDAIPFISSELHGSRFRRVGFACVRTFTSLTGSGLSFVSESQGRSNLLSRKPIVCRVWDSHQFVEVASGSLGGVLPARYGQ